MLEYKIYNPNPHVNAGADWGFAPSASVSLDQVRSEPVRVAAIPVCSTDSHVFCYDPAAESIDWSQFDLVLLSDIEYYSLRQIQDWIKRVGIKNYRLAIGGWHWCENHVSEHIIYRPWWAFNLMRMNQPRVVNTQGKKFLFECLLGARRAHRDFAMFELTRKNLLGQGLVTYRDIFQGSAHCEVTQQVAQHFAPATLNWPYVADNLDPAWEVSDQLSYSISPYVPWNIYDHSWYSLVAETVGYAPTFFLSEKTTKVLYAQRVAVWLAPQYFLRTLKELGFETFDNVIDESYDNEPDPIRRWTRAVEQIEYLQSLDPRGVYQQCRARLEHNQQWLMSWPARVSAEQQTMIASAIQSLG